MKVTKLTHACLLVEEDTKNLLIDPGIFTKDLPKNIKNLSAIIITHAHPDHIDAKTLEEIQKSNPATPIYAPAQVADSYSSIKFQVIERSQTIKVDSFSIDCYLIDHAIIFPNLPVLENVAIMVNDNLFYPGDSFYMPEKSVATLACPASAPWLKISEVTNYIDKVKPTTVFPTHDGILSEAGKSVHYRMIAEACDNANAEWTPLQPKVSIDI